MDMYLRLNIGQYASRLDFTKNSSTGCISIYAHTRTLYTRETDINIINILLFFFILHRKFTG